MADTTHTHAKKGGGTLTHAHDSADEGHGHDDALPLPTDADDDGDSADLAETNALFALDFGDAARFAEGKPIPFLTTGEWTFPEFAHILPEGKLSVSQDTLRMVKQHFDERRRGQDLPIINEAHDDSRAVGWIKSLEFSDPDNLVAVPDWNPVGEKVIKNDEYRYTSPELIPWRDPASGETYPIIASGLALTNYPRIKKLGRIAASENASCALVACSEKGVKARDVVEARRLLMAENDPDNDGDDDGPVPPCVYQPPYSPIGCCPGFTRRGDADGDGACIFSEKGCNGYQAVPVGNTAGVASIPLTWGEPRVTTQTTNSTNATFQITGVTATMAEPTTKTPEQPAPEPQPAEAVTLAEEHRALKARFEASEKAREDAEKERVALSEKVAAMERDRTVSGIRAEFAELVREGRVSPAEVETLLKDDEHAVKLSENRFVIDALKARPKNSAVPFGEKGSAGDKGDADAHHQLLQMAEEIRKGDPSLTREQAYVRAMEHNPNLGAEAAAVPGIVRA